MLTFNISSCNVWGKWLYLIKYWLGYFKKMALTHNAFFFFLPSAAQHPKSYLWLREMDNGSLLRERSSGRWQLCLWAGRLQFIGTTTTSSSRQWLLWAGRRCVSIGRTITIVLRRRILYILREGGRRRRVGVIGIGRSLSRKHLWDVGVSRWIVVRRVGAGVHVRWCTIFRIRQALIEEPGSAQLAQEHVSVPQVSGRMCAAVVRQQVLYSAAYLFNPFPLEPVVLEEHFFIPQHHVRPVQISESRPDHVTRDFDAFKELGDVVRAPSSHILNLEGCVFRPSEELYLHRVFEDARTLYFAFSNIFLTRESKVACLWEMYVCVRERGKLFAYLSLGPVACTQPLD